MDSITMSPPSHEQKALDTTLKRLWDAALQEYDQSRGATGSKGFSAPVSGDVCTIESLEALIKGNENEFKSFRAKREKLTAALKTTLGPIQALGNVASGAVSNVFAPSSSIFSAVAFLVTAAQNVSSKYDTIIAMFDDIHRFTKRLDILLERDDLRPELCEEVVKTMALILKFIGVVEKAIRDGRTVTFFKRTLTSEDPVQKVRLELDGSVTQILRLVDSLAYVESGKHQKDEMIARDRQEKRRKWAALEKRLDVNRAMPDILDELSRAKLAQTCEWIRRDPAFIRWMDGSAHVLWVSGRMGTGKTHLAADLVNFLRPTSESQEAQCSSRTAFYFCGKSVSGIDSSRRILDTLTWQLACQSGAFFNKAISVYDVPGTSSSSKEIWERLYRAALNSSIDEEYVLVIDGLDEVDEAVLEDLLQQLEWLRLQALGCGHSAAEIANKKPRLKIVALGRPSHDGHVNGYFQQAMESIEIIGEKSADDLRAYIRESIDRSREICQSRLQKEIVETLEKGADGSFLWVKLKVKEISQQNQVAQIMAILRRPPAELGEQLEKTLHSLSGSDHDAHTLNTILTFLTWFEGRIHLDELAVVPKLESTDLGEDEGFMDLEYLLVEKYRPLFKLQRDDGLTVESLRHFAKSSDLSWIDDSEQTLLETERSNATLRLPRQHHQPSSRRSSFGSSRSRQNYLPGATTALFDHLSYHQYFREKARIEAGKVILDKNLALCRIVKICLRLLTDKSTFIEFGLDHSLTKHAALYFPRYLAGIQRTRLPLDSQRHIAQALSCLFEDRQLTRRWIAILAALPARTDIDQMLQEMSLNETNLMSCFSWLEPPTDEGFVGPNDQLNQPTLMTWFQSWLPNLFSRLGLTPAQPREVPVETRFWLLKQSIACAISDEWLSSHEWVDERASPTKLHALFLCAFIAKTQNPLLTDDAFNEDYLPMTPGIIKNAASWYLWLHHSNTSVWHTCLALTYYGLGYRWSTIRACEQALSNDKKAWHAYYLLSLSHLDLGHGQTALSFADKCLECWPYDLAWTKLHYRFLRHRAECKYAVDDGIGAHSAMADLLRERPADLRAFRAYISFVDDNELWDNCDPHLIGNAVNALHGSQSNRFQCSQMSELLLDNLVRDGLLQGIVIRSLRAAGQLALGQEIIVQAIETAERLQKLQYVAALKIDLADVLYERKHSIPHAVRCLQQVLNSHSGVEGHMNDLSLVQQQVRYRAIANLTRYMSARLLMSINEGDRPGQMASYQTLKRLWDDGTQINAHIPIWLWFQRHCWFHCFLASSKMQDRKTFQEFWSSGLYTVMRMLSSPGSGIHEEGLPFRRLAYMSQIRGRTDDVLAALSVRNLMNSTMASCKAVGDDISFYDTICDGPCADKSQPWRTGQGLSSCQLCLDTDWCDECMVRLKKGEIAYTLCSANHTFVSLKPFKKPVEGFIMRGSRMVRITDWISELAEECGQTQYWEHVKSRVETRRIIGTARHSNCGSQEESDVEYDSDEGYDSVKNEENNVSPDDE